MAIQKKIKRTLSAFRCIGRWLQARISRCGLILMYHRVAKIASDPHLLAVTPEHFAEHLEVLQKRFCVVSVGQLIEGLRAGKPLRRAVAITFDDGYADNLYYAKPVLERYGVPATVFVTAGHVGQDYEFWWDELDRLLLQPGTLPACLRLNLNGRSYQWRLDDAADYSEEDFQRQRSWNVLVEEEPGPRQRLFRSLFQLLPPLPTKERGQVLAALQLWAGAGPKGRATHRTLSPEEVVRLAEGGLVEIGAHTMTHPVLSAQPVAEQRAEIEGSKARLEEILGRPVSSFAYPFGGRRHYCGDTVAAVREAGFFCACSNFRGRVDNTADLFQLPRFMVFDWNGDEFAQNVRQWFRG